MIPLVAQNCQFSYGTDSVIRDVHFECRAGEFVSILGASGCGKSTLLRLFAGLLEPTAGSVLVGGRPASTARDEASFVFQQPTLCPWRTVADNISLPLLLAGRSRDAQQEAALGAIALVGLQPSDATKLPRQLSGGMQMRVSLARALVTRPSVMLLDEPFSALDEVLRQQLGEKTHELWMRQKWTTVLVTHSVEEAIFMSQRVLLLAGRPASIVQDISIPFGERDIALRTSDPFLRLVAEVGISLRRAVEKTSQEWSGEELIRRGVRV